VTTGGLILLTGLVNAIEGRIENYMREFGAYIAVAIENEDDDQCSRLACGLVTDIANHIDR
jgi:hypothetical protein